MGAHRPPCRTQQSQRNPEEFRGYAITMSPVSQNPSGQLGGSQATTSAIDPSGLPEPMLVGRPAALRRIAGMVGPARFELATS